MIDTGVVPAVHLTPAGVSPTTHPGQTRVNRSLHDNAMALTVILGRLVVDCTREVPLDLVVPVPRQDQNPRQSRHFRAYGHVSRHKIRPLPQQPG